MGKISTLLSLIVAFFVKLAAQPAVKPLLALLHSRRFVLLLIGFLVNYVLPTVPNLSPVWVQRLGDFAFIATGLLALGLSVEDVQAARAGLPSSKAGFTQEIIDTIAQAVLQALSSAPDQSQVSQLKLPTGGVTPGETVTATPTGVA